MAEHDPEQSNSKRGGVLAGAVMIALLVGGVVMSAAGGTALAPLEGLLDGTWSGNFERRYDEGLPLHPAAAAAWDLFRYLVFREASPGALIGRGDWLFTSEEFAPPEAGPGTLAGRLDRVREVDRALDARGIALVTVIVPAKARVYSDKLGRYSMSAAFEARYAAIRRGLAARGVAAPDLLTGLEQARSAEPVFLKTDSHWTPHGARVAAQAAAPAVIEVLEQSNAPRLSFSASPGEAKEHRGDLVNFIRLGPRLERFGPDPDRVHPTVAQQEGGPGLGLFDELTIPVVLVGTSYSAGSLWGFDQALKAALQADVLNVAVEGRGPFEPMVELLESGVLAEVGADVVIWEIPERYFPFPP